MKLFKNKKKKSKKPKYLTVTYSYVTEMPSVNLETGETILQTVDFNHHLSDYLNIDSNISESKTFGKTTVILEYPKRGRKYSHLQSFPLILHEAGSFHKVTEYRQPRIVKQPSALLNTKSPECTSVSYGARFVYFNTFGLCNWKYDLMTDFLGTDECQFLEYCALLKNISQKEKQYPIFSERRIRRKFQHDTEIEILENDKLISFLIPCKMLNAGTFTCYGGREGELPNSFRDLVPSSNPNHLFVKAVISKTQYKRLRRGLSFRGWIFSEKETCAQPGIMIDIKPVF